MPLIPVNPMGQEHENSPMPSRQVPPFMQGKDAHSLIFTSQFLPVKPLGQWQVKLFTMGTHLPPFIHGTDTHISVGPTGV